MRIQPPTELSDLAAKVNLAVSQGRHRQAVEMLEGQPNAIASNLSLAILLGTLYVQTGDSRAAQNLLESVIAAEPDNFDALYWLSTNERNLGDLGASIEHARQATVIRPGEGHAWMNLGFSLREADRLGEAAGAFSRACELLTTSPVPFHLCGDCLHAVGDLSQAEKYLMRALSLAPESGEVMVSLGRTKLQAGQTSHALRFAQRALAKHSKSVPALQLMTDVLIEQENYVEAERVIDLLLRLRPSDDRALALKGIRLQARGNIREAQESFRLAIHHEPGQAFAYCALVQSAESKDERIALESPMERLLGHGGLSQKSVAYLQYGLARIAEDRGDFELAMKRLDLANSITRKLNFGDRPFDRAGYTANVDWTISTFTPSFLLKHLNPQPSSDKPVFIVGMMRSGTTLVEQVVTSHPSVASSGENRFWRDHWEGAFQAETKQLLLQKLHSRARDYLAQLTAIDPAAARVTDKMPGNYAILGLLHLALPGAKFIHVRRHPIDTCLSIYSLGAAFKVPFANDRVNIAFAYKEYIRLMAHWRQVLSTNRFYEIDYEALVENREVETRNLLQFCGLDWHSACLNPHENTRIVNTPSAVQVRRPISNQSIGRWKNFRPWLGALEDLAADE